MHGYRRPSGPLRIKEEIEPGQVKAFNEAIDDLGVVRSCFLSCARA